MSAVAAVVPAVAEASELEQEHSTTLEQKLRALLDRDRLEPQAGSLDWVGELILAAFSWLLLAWTLVFPYAIVGVRGWPFAGVFAGAVALAAGAFVGFRRTPAESWPELGFGFALVALALVSLAFAPLELVTHPRALLATHAPPLGVVVVACIVLFRERIVLLLRNVPVFLPIIVGAPLVSLFSEDLWRVAAATDVERGASLAAIAVGGIVVLSLVVVRRMRNSVDEAFTTTVDELDADKVADRLLGRIRKLDTASGRFGLVAREFRVRLRSSASGRPEVSFEDYARAVLRPAFVRPFVKGYAEVVRKDIEGELRHKVTVRFVLLVAGVSVGLWVFMYVIAAVAVGSQVVHDWTHRPIHHLGTPEWGIRLPDGPYLVMAAFLTVAAMLVFLSLALTRNEHSTELAETLLHQPLRDWLSAKIPLLHLSALGGDTPLQPNDRLDRAFVLAGYAGSVRGDNLGAASEEGEPAHAGRRGGNSLWYRWTSPATRRVTFDTAGSDFDTLLAVYRGDNLGALQAVASASGVADAPSRVAFAAEAGLEYLVAVDGDAGRTGHVVLNWRLPPPNDALAAAERLGERSGSVRADNHGASAEPGEPDHAGAGGGASVWYRWTAPVAGYASFDTLGSDFDTLLAVYRGSSVDRLEPVAANDDADGGRQSRVVFEATEGGDYAVAVDGYGGRTGGIVLNWSVQPPNDDYAAAQPLAGPEGAVDGWNDGAGAEASEPDHAGRPARSSVWYRWTAPQTGTAAFETLPGERMRVAVYEASRSGALELQQPREGTDGIERLSFCAAKDVVYAIAVDSVDRGGPFRLRWCFVPEPANNRFEHAQRLVGASGSVTGENRGATNEEWEPPHAGKAGGASVWYRWTAPASGRAVFDTFGSSFDTLLAVYRGAPGELELVEENDDFHGYQSRVEFAAQEGVEYAVAVDGYHATTGAIVLNWLLADPS